MGLRLPRYQGDGLAVVHDLKRLALGVDTFNLASFSGDEIVKIPYTYRVG